MTSPFVAFVRLMPTASRRVRRLLVAAAFLGFPLQSVGYAALMAPGRVPLSVWAPLSVILFGATLVGVVGIYGYARGRADMKAELDERQRQIRDQAWILAYGLITTVVTIAIAILTLAASFNGPVTIGMNELTPIVVALGLYLPILPSATLAWSEPDAPNDDEMRTVR